MRVRWPTSRLCGLFSMARLDHKATAISLLVVLGVRGWSEGLHAVKATGGESSDAWRSVLDDLIGRGLCRPHFPDRCPTRCPVRDRNRGAKPRRQRRHQAVPLHDKHVFDMHVLAAPRRYRQTGP